MQPSEMKLRSFQGHEPGWSEQAFQKGVFAAMSGYLIQVHFTFVRLQRQRLLMQSNVCAALVQLNDASEAPQSIIYLECS